MDWENAPDDVAFDILHDNFTTDEDRLLEALQAAHAALDEQQFIVAMDHVLEATRLVNRLGCMAAAGASRWQSAAMTHRTDQQMAAVRDFMASQGITGEIVMIAPDLRD